MSYENKIVNEYSEDYYFKSFTAFHKSVMINKKSFSLLQLNVAGINNMTKFRRLKEMLLCDMKFKCDIIVLSETKLKQQQTNYITLMAMKCIVVAVTRTIVAVDCSYTFGRS